MHIDTHSVFTPHLLSSIAVYDTFPVPATLTSIKKKKRERKKEKPKQERSSQKRKGKVEKERCSSLVPNGAYFLACFLRKVIFDRRVQISIGEFSFKTRVSIRG